MLVVIGPPGSTCRASLAENSRVGNPAAFRRRHHDGVPSVDPRQLIGHVIVCGLAGVGFRTVEQLHLAAVPVVVVDDDPDPRLARVVQGWGVPHIHGDPRLGDGLQAAGLDGAVAVVCTAADDLHALETALRARELRPGVRVVAQLANPSVGQALRRVTDEQSVLDVAALAAPSFVEACVGSPSHPLDLDGVLFSVVELEVEPDVGTPSGPHATFRGRFGDLAPVAVVPGDGSDMALCPGRDHPIAPGDRVAVLGTPAELGRADIDPAQLGRPPAPPGIGSLLRAASAGGAPPSRAATGRSCSCWAPWGSSC